MVSLLDDDGLLDLLRRPSSTAPGGTPATASLPAGPSPSPAASVCALCGKRPPRDRCTACGRPACAADLWVMLRLCRGCASDGDVERGQRGARPEATNWLDGGR